MDIVQTLSFSKSIKKLNQNQKQDLDGAVRVIAKNPEIGELKVGDLAGVRVYKFRMNQQLCLLAYIWQSDRLVLTLLALGSHENFYRDLKSRG